MLIFISICSFILCFSIEDLIDYKYNLIISEEPVLLSEVTFNENNVSHRIKNQDYICELPTDYERYVEKESISHPSDVLKDYYDLCLELESRDYWNFSICIGKNITQYHKDPDGVIRGENYFLIGKYTGEKSWEDDDLIQSPKSGKANYHSQFYGKGSECQPNVFRTGETRFYCGSVRNNISIESYYEDKNCNYVFSIILSDLCDIPSFYLPDKNQIFPIKCHPIYNHNRYELYRTRLERQQKSLSEIHIEHNIGSQKVNIISGGGGDFEDIINLIIRKLPLVQDIKESHQDDPLHKNYDTSTIIEKENDRSIIRWQISYNKPVNFDKILKQVDNLRQNSMPNFDRKAYALMKSNLAAVEKQSIENGNEL